MGFRCFSVFILLIINQSVFARNCNYIVDSSSADDCDECVRCGGTWCNDLNENRLCVSDIQDNWCPANREIFDVSQKTERNGYVFDLSFVEKTVFAGGKSVTPIKIVHLPPVKTTPKARYEIVNTTQFIRSPDKIINVAIVSNKLLVTTAIGHDFCSSNSTRWEYIYVKVGLIGAAEEVLLKFYVPCACDCSKTIERNSEFCTYFGDLSCGVCHCREGRTGTRCEKKTCTDRGDSPLTCNNPSNPKVMCSGNGHCNECHECECFTDYDIEGSQYFDPDNYCEGLCSTLNTCTDCLKNPELGLCDTCATPYVYIQNVNESLLKEWDDNQRKVWVHCHVELPGCGLVEYAAKALQGKKHLMVMKTCAGTSKLIAAGDRGITVPVVATLLAVIAALVAAGVGYAVWKGRTPPLQLGNSQYSNIEPVDSTGVNPLYKPPTSSFKNPMYGKC